MTCTSDGWADPGAEYVVATPLEVWRGDTLPHEGTGQDTVQFTPPLAASLVTVAVTCVLAPGGTDAAPDATVTLRGPLPLAPPLPLPPPPPLPLPSPPPPHAARPMHKPTARQLRTRLEVSFSARSNMSNPPRPSVSYRRVRSCDPCHLARSGGSLTLMQCPPEDGS
jgi:hypothetical protein